VKEAYQGFINFEIPSTSNGRCEAKKDSVSTVSGYIKQALDAVEKLK